MSGMDKIYVDGSAERYLRDGSEEFKKHHLSDIIFYKEYNEQSFVINDEEVSIVYQLQYRATYNASDMYKTIYNISPKSLEDYTILSIVKLTIGHILNRLLVSDSIDEVESSPAYDRYTNALFDLVGKYIDRDELNAYIKKCVTISKGAFVRMVSNRQYLYYINADSLDEHLQCKAVPMYVESDPS